jgi:hypothetical protein
MESNAQWRGESTPRQGIFNPSADYILSKDPALFGLGLFSASK